MTSTSAASSSPKTVYSILFFIAMGHFLNDMMQSVIPSVYPILKQTYQLNFTQIGLITFTFQLTASLLQPFVGFYTDKNPKPYSLVIAMLFTLSGMVSLAYASSFYGILASVSLVGIGSSIFHPEASRVAFLGSGGKRGLAQSIFQLGGNSGSALGPLLVALLVVPYGQFRVIWFVLAAIAGILVLYRVAVWYHFRLLDRSQKKTGITILEGISARRVKFSIAVLLVLIFSKFIYMASMTSYYTFYLMKKFSLSIQDSQFYLFWFLVSVALGTLIGGPLGDRIGRKAVIWFSILGCAPFAIALPYVELETTVALTIVIGLIMSSAFSSILVFAQELLPGKVGMISGLFFGFAFGMGGLGSAFLGNLADDRGIEFVYHVCSFLPLIGILAYFLPKVKQSKV